MGRGDDVQGLLKAYINSWKTEDLESQCWRRNQVGRISQLDDKRGGDYFRTDLQNALGSSNWYNVQIQPNAASRSSKSEKIQWLKSATGRSQAFVLIHRDAEPKAAAVRDAFESSSSENKMRLHRKENYLFTRVVIDADGGWRNETTGVMKPAADYEAHGDAIRCLVDELSDDLQNGVSHLYGKILQWDEVFRKKQDEHTMSAQDWIDFETKKDQLRKEIQDGAPA